MQIIITIFVHGFPTRTAGYTSADCWVTVPVHARHETPELDRRPTRQTPQDSERASMPHEGNLTWSTCLISCTWKRSIDFLFPFSLSLDLSHTQYTVPVFNPSRLASAKQAIIDPFPLCVCVLLPQTSVLCPVTIPFAHSRLIGNAAPLLSFSPHTFAFPSGSRTRLGSQNYPELTSVDLPPALHHCQIGPLLSSRDFCHTISRLRFAGPNPQHRISSFLGQLPSDFVSS